MVQSKYSSVREHFEHDSRPSVSHLRCIAVNGILQHIIFIEEIGAHHLVRRTPISEIDPLRRNGEGVARVHRRLEDEEIADCIGSTAIPVVSLSVGIEQDNLQGRSVLVRQEVGRDCNGKDRRIGLGVRISSSTCVIRRSVHRKDIRYIQRHSARFSTVVSN